MNVSLYSKINDMKQEEIEIVKNTIYSVVEGHIDSEINYEWVGSDFTDRIMVTYRLIRKCLLLG